MKHSLVKKLVAIVSALTIKDALIIRAVPMVKAAETTRVAEKTRAAFMTRSARTVPFSLMTAAALTTAFLGTSLMVAPPANAATVTVPQTSYSGNVTSYKTELSFYNATSFKTAPSFKQATDIVWKRLPGGEIRLSWSADERTKKQQLNISLNNFSKTDKADHVIKVSASARSYRLTAKDLKKIGAPIGSGAGLFVRIATLDKTGTQKVSALTRLFAGQPNKKAVKGAAKVKFATYNTAFEENRGEGLWKKQIPKVAKNIASSKAAVVALQESAFLTPNGSSPRVNNLLKAVKKSAKKVDKKANWKLVRSSRYTAPEKGLAGDSTRIMYDAAKVKLVSKCTETTGKRKYSDSCTIKLPRIGGIEKQRFAAYAQFQDRKTKQKFWVVSLHLAPEKGKSYDKNRLAQLKTINKALNKLNKKNEPVVLMGDFNASIKREQDRKAMLLVNKWGYTDSATAKKAKNINYLTYNGWKKQQKLQSIAPRIDLIMVKGKKTFIETYDNKINGHSAADHNLISAVVSLKK